MGLKRRLGVHNTFILLVLGNIATVICINVNPKTPTIISVNESMGNFKVFWLTNMEGILSESLTAEVTYHVKGSTREFVAVKQTAANGRNNYVIQGQLLKPSTTYAVSVRMMDSSKTFSDSSDEREFTTRRDEIEEKTLQELEESAMSSDTLFAIISLCVAAVLISGVIYGCFVKLRSKWWDTVEKCPNPKLLDMHPSEQKFLKTAPPIFSSVCVEPLSDDRRLWFKHPLKDSSDGSLQQSSGIGSGSSCLRDANSEPADIISEVQDATRKALSKIIISTTSPLTTGLMTDFPQDSSLLCAPHNLCDVQDEDMSSGLSAFLNKTYSIPIPGDPVQTTTDISEVQIEMPCETAHRPSEGATVISTYQQAAPCPPITLPFSLIPTDISYQPCNTNSGTCSFQDSGISSVSSGTNTTQSCDPVCEVEAACEGFENGKIDAEAIVSDENPCSVPAESHSIPAVDYDYQPFQHLVEPSVFISDMKGGEKEEHCNHPEDPYIKTPQTV
ncbi:uncharacterized protein LOC121505290 isoform X2 [Cheilinus undulatus]|uniref:uncharacterized protein LOC121505290 isoform X2 n=1 Tax=Cheilinus undulatus TaxID=241271 RepID=UPI001BD65809|nr:uncharacterized protein LOC121505290 isoform X2 [Cheilinus undulatus]